MKRGGAVSTEARGQYRRYRGGIWHPFWLVAGAPLQVPVDDVARVHKLHPRHNVGCEAQHHAGGGAHGAGAGTAAGQRARARGKAHQPPATPASPNPPCGATRRMAGPCAHPVPWRRSKSEPPAMYSVTRHRLGGSTHTPTKRSTCGCDTWGRDVNRRTGRARGSLASHQKGWRRKGAGGHTHRVQHPALVHEVAVDALGGHLLDAHHFDGDHLVRQGAGVSEPARAGLQGCSGRGQAANHAPGPRGARGRAVHGAAAGAGRGGAGRASRGVACEALWVRYLWPQRHRPAKTRLVRVSSAEHNRLAAAAQRGAHVQALPAAAGAGSRPERATPREPVSHSSELSEF